MKPARAGLGLALCVALTASAAERAPYEEFRLAVDPDLGAEMGMLAVTSPARLALRGVDFAAERWKPSSPWAGAGLRVAELVLVDAAVAAHANLLTHELFGHGARAREIGLAPTYELSAPLPYAYLLSRGGFGGQTFLSTREPDLSLDERVLVATGGFESEALQARYLAFTSFRAGTLRHGDALMYFLYPPHLWVQLLRSNNDLSRSFELREQLTGADVGGQRMALGLTSLVSLVDPLFLFSASCALYRFIVRGERLTPFPALSLGAWRLSATARPVVLPWGQEVALDVLGGSRLINLDATLRAGGGPGGASAGLTLQAADFRAMNEVYLGARLDLFWQPRVQALYVALNSTAGYPGQVAGFGLRLSAELRRPPYFIGIEAGGKTEGIVDASPVGPNFVGRLTFGLLLPQG